MPELAARLQTALSDRYRLEGEIGAGGMATVYLAQDLRHDRRVALKVLRPELAAVIGAERFLAEIKLTANLQHPHILPLFDSGEADSFLFYVMPYIEGESLRDRLQREKQLPVDDAVRTASEVASALDYAHRHGVVHRDIKPENILLHDGQALVADFGIALAASKASGSRMTETGMSLGTPHYMSPEQAMGEREITARSDVYALGAVLYEMLTGDPPFTGSTAQAIVARVVTESPRPLIPQRHTIPPHVEAAVLTALEKLPADRYGTAAEFAEALANPSYASRTTTVMTTAAGAPGAVRWRRAFWAAAAVALASVALGAWGWMRARAASRQPTSWQYITVGDSVAPSNGFPSLALSPDGSAFVFRDDVVGGLLWVKRRAELNPTPIPGTERANNPVFSPDGEWVAFIADGRLKKVRFGSGASITLADSVAGPYGAAAWLDDGTLVYVTPTVDELRRVSAAGGASTLALRDTAMGGLGIGMPTALPGARGVLFQGCSSGCVTMSVHVADLRTGKQKTLLDGAAQAWYLPTGHLLYVRPDGVALVAPFDLERLEVSGAAVPVLEGVLVGAGFAHVAWSATGSLVYLRGAGRATDFAVVRVTRDGAVAPYDSTWYGRFNSLALSPDGRHLAVGSGSSTGGLNIWLKKLDRGPFTRLTFGGQDRRPVWSPDGRLAAFVRDTVGTSIVMARPADGSGPDRLLVRIDRQIQEVDWSRDGRWMVVRTDNSTSGAGDIVGIRTEGDSTPVPLVASSFTELHPALSPDGRWLAYTSNESGTNEVYVRPFPNTADGRWQVSNGGGTGPRWSLDGRELYFLDAGSRLIAAQVARGAAFSTASSLPLFDASGFQLDAFHQSYDVTHDGRFIFTSPRQVAADSRAPQLVRVDNWFRDVRARLAQ
jgi:tRNA A-37 threonylcarbamoyl transferase component Bud32